MTVLLNSVDPPYLDVAKLGAKVLGVYTILFEAAKRDIRGDCGGTTSWSTSGLASRLSMSRNTAQKALDVLLDNGWISVIGTASSGVGKPHRVYRILHPSLVEAQQYAIDVIGTPPSIRYKDHGVRQKAELEMSVFEKG
jgi:hypothetical protein